MNLKLQSTIRIHSLIELEIFAKSIAEQLKAEASIRHILLLDGPMGAGKTQFTKSLVEAMGSTEACSPSFAIHNSYRTAQDSVEHFDLFRLESSDDLESTGFWDFFLNPSGLVIIEWSVRLHEMGLSGQLPLNWKKIRFEFAFVSDDPNARLIHCN